MSKVNEQILNVLLERGPMDTAELVSRVYHDLQATVTKHQINNARLRLKSGKVIRFLKDRPGYMEISPEYLSKNQIPEISLTEAVSLLFRHHDKQTPLSFLILFQDGDKDGRAVHVQKRWDHVHEEWVYGIKEPYCPTLISDDSSFIGNLAGIRGISFGGNAPDYTVTLE